MTIASYGPVLTRFYYSVKPYIPLGLRWAVRRKIAAGIRERNADTWPIDEAAVTAPRGWQGWPDGKKFAFVLTHDVESGCGLEQVRKLAEMEVGHGLRSSFNFIPKGGYKAPSELFEWLTDRGFEVGVHDLHHDGKLYRTRDTFRSNAGQINAYLRMWGAKGFRAGFMLRQLDWLHDLEIDYDASTFDTDPFEPQPDGCQTIFPFFVPDQSKDDGSGYVELPYTLPQDSTLFLLLGERNPDVWLRKLDWIAENGGLALVNIHPDYIDFHLSDFSNFRYPASLVHDLLQQVKTRHAGAYWNPLPKELAAWFRGTCSPHTPAGNESQAGESPTPPR